jgi:hypothetical protein
MGQREAESDAAGVGFFGEPLAGGGRVPADSGAGDARDLFLEASLEERRRRTGRAEWNKEFLDARPGETPFQSEATGV